MDAEIVAALIGPLLTAGLAAVAVLLKSMRERRDRATERRNRISAASSQVEFLHAWLVAYEKAAPPELFDLRRREVLRDLDLAYARMAQVVAEPDTPGRGVSVVDVMRKLLLLGLRRGAAKAVRFLYYAAVVLSLLFILVGATSPEIWSGEDLVVTMLTMMLMTGFLTVPCWLLWFWAMTLDRKRVSAPVTPAGRAAQPHPARLPPDHWPPDSQFPPQPRVDPGREPWRR